MLSLKSLTREKNVFTLPLQAMKYVCVLSREGKASGVVIVTGGWISSLQSCCQLKKTHCKNITGMVKLHLDKDLM